MRRTVRVVVAAALIVVGVMSIGSCRYLGFLNPGWALQGSWEIRAKPDVGWEAHTYFVFLPGAEGYQILDADRAVFESGVVFNLTDTNFEYTIQEQTLMPSIVGGQNYAVYTLNRDDLSITFYDGPEKTANFGTISAVRE